MTKRIPAGGLPALTALLLASLACSSLSPGAAPQPASTVAAITVPAPAVAAPPTQQVTISSAEEQVLIDLYARTSPAVVSILIDVGTLGGGQGSGFLYDADGHIVTNQHVVEGASQIEVHFPSGLKTRGRVIGSDADADLAVIKVDALPEGIQPLALGDSDLVRVGQRAIAIGNPFGEAGTLTFGVISGLGRTLSGNRDAPGGGRFTAPDVIQTDAPINPGNSGGPLLNMSGEVIGVNRAIATESGVNSGVGYAVASNTIRQIVPFLIRDGKFVYPYLGMTSLSEISLALQEELGLPGASGVYVTSITAGSPADRAGLRGDSARISDTSLRGDGDLIIAIDGRPVRVFGDLMSYLVNATRPGQEVSLTVLRGGERLDVALVLGERP